MNNQILSCDWGTTSFRLRLISLPEQQLAGEITSSDGVASTFSAWQRHDAPLERSQFFRQQLKKQIDQLAQKVSLSLDTIPLFISGMASSSIGMFELPYATLPFPIDGSRALVKHFDAQPDFPNDIFLISGVRSQHNVMRGEETQMVGLLELITAQTSSAQDTIVLLPGTHSKHLHVQDGQLIDFQTFMTGEVFNQMAHQSILKDSVETSSFSLFSQSGQQAFIAGVQEAEAGSLLDSLFKVRTNQLFGNLSKPDNAFYLSGLLIGSELKTLVARPGQSLLLCSGAQLHEPYRLALQTLGLLERAGIVADDLLNKATVAGQISIIQNQYILSTHA